MACTSPKSKESGEKTETKTETTQTKSKDDNKSSSDTKQKDTFEAVKGDVKMEFKINNLNSDGKSIRLIGMYVDKKYVADSALIHDKGMFEFTGDKLFPKGFYYIVLPNNTVIKLLLDTKWIFTDIVL